MKKFGFLAAAVMAVLLTSYYLLHPLGTKVSIRNHIFTVDLAITDSEKERGLAYRDSLPRDHGMIFPYDHSDRYSFWMKGMRFPIDIIWIRDGKIIDISKNVPVATTSYLPTYSPKDAVNQILEVNAGVSDTYGFTEGDTVRFLR